jgi:hypothetical protein
LLGSEEDLVRVLEAKARFHRTSGGVHFLLPFQYISFLPVMFLGVQAAVRRCSKTSDGHCFEKDAVAWFKPEELHSVHLRGAFATDVTGIVDTIKQPYVK